MAQNRTLLLKKSQNGSRINRSVGMGTWMGEDSVQPLGFKKRLRYEGGVPHQVGAAEEKPTVAKEELRAQESAENQREESRNSTELEMHKESEKTQ
ncbi:hypothetical protein QQP08_004649 [Theobroma cacao]|nr:hypothetical protein QQP08_004649 [Theobroma cacao]